MVRPYYNIQHLPASCGMVETKFLLCARPCEAGPDQGQGSGASPGTGVAEPGPY